MTEEKNTGNAQDVQADAEKPAGHEAASAGPEAAEAQPKRASGQDSEQAPKRPQGQASASVDVSRRIPGTSVAVMIFILLVAFACTGVQVVMNMVEANNAPEEIKGKNPTPQIEYPTEAVLPEGVAAEVNGVEIPESAIDDYIASLRERLGLQDQEAWDAWMIESGRTTENLRNKLIMYYIDQEIINQMAEEAGIVPSEEDLEKTLKPYASPEAREELDAFLASQGMTFEDYLVDVDTLTKQRLIGEKFNEGTLQSQEFADAVLKSIQATYPEYADVESLDAVDPEIVEQTREELATISNNHVFVSKFGDFVNSHDVLYAKMKADRPYQSGSDVFFMKQQLKEMLEKNGLLEEGGIFDSLIADSEDGGEQ